jgi:hypothetical protein
MRTTKKNAAHESEWLVHRRVLRPFVFSPCNFLIFVGLFFGDIILMECPFPAEKQGFPETSGMIDAERQANTFTTVTAPHCSEQAGMEVTQV